MQRRFANQSLTLQALAQKLQQTLRQAQQHELTFTTQLANDSKTRAYLDQLLIPSVTNPHVFFTTFIGMIHVYKTAHRNKLRRNQPHHKQIWQIIYGEHHAYRAVIKPLLTMPGYGLDRHGHLWATVFNNVIQQLQQQLASVEHSAHARHFALFSQTCPPEAKRHALPLAQAPHTMGDEPNISAAAQTPQSQIIHDDADTLSSNDQPSSSTLTQRVKQFHQAHAVYFKLVKYILIATALTAIIIGASISLAILLDAAFDLGALCTMLGVTNKVIAVMETVVLLATKELFQLAKKNVQQRFKNYTEQPSQTSIETMEADDTANIVSPTPSPLANRHTFFHRAKSRELPLISPIINHAHAPVMCS